MEIRLAEPSEAGAAVAILNACGVEMRDRLGVPDWLLPSIPGTLAADATAARLFVDFLLSKEGQSLIRSRGRVPARNDLGSVGEDAPLKVHYVSPRLAPQFNAYEKEFRQVFGGSP